MTPGLFIEKWKQADLSERSAYQRHFLDLCDFLDEKKRVEVEPTGHWFTFEKGLTTTDDKKELRASIPSGQGSRCLR